MDGEFDYDQNDFIGNKVDIDLVDATNGKVYLKSGEKFNVVIAKSLEKDSVKKLFISNEGIIGSYLANDIFDKNNGIIFFEAGDEITQETIDFLEQKNTEKISILNINSNSRGTYIRDTFFADKNKNRNDAVNEIYKILRPGEPLQLKPQINYLEVYSLIERDMIFLL